MNKKNIFAFLFLFAFTLIIISIVFSNILISYKYEKTNELNDDLETIIENVDDIKVKEELIDFNNDLKFFNKVCFNGNN